MLLEDTKNPYVLTGVIRKIPGLSESPIFSETQMGGTAGSHKDVQNSKVIAVSLACMKVISTSMDTSKLHHNPPLLSMHNTAAFWALCSTT